MDYEHVLCLLRVVDLSRGYPQLKAVHDGALHELEQVASDLAKPKPVVPKREYKPEPRPAPVEPSPVRRSLEGTFHVNEDSKHG